MPWSDFGNAEIGLSAWRLVVLGILILLFRRLPWVLLLRKLIPDLVTWQEGEFRHLGISLHNADIIEVLLASFAGWFGPIGKSRRLLSIAPVLIKFCS